MNFPWFSLCSYSLNRTCSYSFGFPPLFGIFAVLFWVWIGRQEALRQEALFREELFGVCQQ